MDVWGWCALLSNSFVFSWQHCGTGVRPPQASGRMLSSKRAFTAACQPSGHGRRTHGLVRSVALSGDSLADAVTQSTQSVSTHRFAELQCTVLGEYLQRRHVRGRASRSVSRRTPHGIARPLPSQ